MRKVLSVLFAVIAVAAVAQAKGRFEVHDLGCFRLHVYYSNDVMADVSYIIEGDGGLVTMEHLLFRDNVAEFDEYVAKLGKPVEKRIADYHVGGTGDADVVMPGGMPAFVKGDIYGGMMKGFARTFGDAMTDMPTGKAAEVAFGSTQTWAGVTFEFSHGASTDFPAASILIGGKAYYTHWVPSRAHVSSLQISSPAAVDAEIAEARKSLASGAELFIGGHGGAAGRDVVEFKIAYLTKMKAALADCKTAEAFADTMKAAYPGLPGEDGLADLGKALYK